MNPTLSGLLETSAVPLTTSRRDLYSMFGEGSIMPYNGLHCTGGCVVRFLTSEEKKRNVDGGVLAGCRLRLAAERDFGGAAFLELTGSAETPVRVRTPSMW